MRQAGIIAAAGIYALENNVNRLVEDHANAKLLVEKLSDTRGLTLDMDRVDTNLTFFKVDPELVSVDTLCEAMREKGVLFNAMGPARIRLCTHLDVTSTQCLEAAELIDQYMSSL